MSLQTQLGGAAAMLERIGVLVNGGRRPYKEGFNEHDMTGQGQLPYVEGVNEHDQEGTGQLPYVSENEHDQEGEGRNSFVEGRGNPDSQRGLSAFMAQVAEEGFVRKNYFYVDILTPASLGQQLNRKVSLLCESTTMPGYNIASAPQIFAGYQYEVPYGITFGDVTMTFYVDGHSDVKGFFDNWILAVFPDGKKWDLNYANSYLSTVTIGQIKNVQDRDKGHSDSQKTGYEIQLFEAFPKTVGDLQYFHGSQGEIHTLQVTFTYKKWIRTIVSQKTASSANNGGGNTITDYNIGSPKSTS